MSKKRNREVRFALIPSSGCTCEVCYMQASKDFSFIKPFNPHGHKNGSCKCRFMPGIKGETTIEGYDSSYYLDVYNNPEKYPEIVEARKEASNSRGRKAIKEKAELNRTIQEESYVFETDYAKRVLGSKIVNSSIGTNFANKIAIQVDKACISDDISRKNAGILFSKYIDDVSGFVRLEKTSCYNIVDNVINLDSRNEISIRTFVHEYFHLIDGRSTISYTVEKIGQTGIIKRTINTNSSWTTILFLKDDLRANSLARMFSLRKNGETRSWTSLKKRLGVSTDAEAKSAIRNILNENGINPSSAESLSDMMHASSNGKVRFTYGHLTKKDGSRYWDNETRVLEFWADYGASAVTNEKEFAIIKQLFPEETEMIDSMIEKMM